MDLIRTNGARHHKFLKRRIPARSPIPLIVPDLSSTASTAARLFGPQAKIAVTMNANRNVSVTNNLFLDRADETGIFVGSGTFRR
jgi:hypothetical protein